MRIKMEEGKQDRRHKEKKQGMSQKKRGRAETPDSQSKRPMI
jgi:hypothetical protein